METNTEKKIGTKVEFLLGVVTGAVMTAVAATSIGGGRTPAPGVTEGGRGSTGNRLVVHAYTGDDEPYPGESARAFSHCAHMTRMDETADRDGDWSRSRSAARFEICLTEGMSAGMTAGAEAAAARRAADRIFRAGDTDLILAAMEEPPGPDRRRRLKEISGRNYGDAEDAAQAMIGKWRSAGR